MGLREWNDLQISLFKAHNVPKERIKIIGGLISFARKLDSIDLAKAIVEPFILAYK